MTHAAPVPAGIIFATPWFGHFGGGVERLCRSFAAALTARGISVRVMTTCCRSPYDCWWEDHLEPGITVHADGYEVERFRVDKGDNRSRYEHALVKQIPGHPLEGPMNDQDRDDFFLCGCVSTELAEALGPWLDRGWECCVAPYFQGLSHQLVRTHPGRVSVITCLHDEPQGAWPQTGRLIADAKQVLFLSPEEKDLALRLHGLDRARTILRGPVIGCGVELPLAGGPVPGLPDRPYFLYVGRKEPGKGLPDVVAWHTAAWALDDTLPPLVIVGGGTAWQPPTHPAVVDLGYQSDADLPRILSGALALVNLSRMESFSYVIMEAWHQGRPVVVHRDGAVTAGHVLRCDGGWTCHDASSYEAALRHYHYHPADADRQGSQGRAYVRRAYSHDAVLTRLLDGFAVAGMAP